MAVIFNPFSGQLILIPNSSGSIPASNVTYDNSSSGLAAVDAQNAIDEVVTRLDATEIVANNAIPSSEKGANNGVAPLDAGGKVASSYLPNTVMEFQGVWNASTNAPTLVDGTGNAGDVYLVTVAGTQNLGSGSQTFAVGDWVVASSSIVWQKSINSNAVVSVNGQQGVVTLTSTNISEGTNLYFTDERSQDAIASSLLNTSTIDFTYNDPSNQISASVNDLSITDNKLTTTGVTAATYGTAGKVPQVTVNSKGRITNVSEVDISLTSASVTDFNEAAQDAVGSILTDSSTIDMTYNDAGNTISASVIESGLNLNNLSGTLSIAKGGTNSSTALNNNRIIVSSSGSLVENPALSPASIIYTDSNGLPAVSSNLLWDNAIQKLRIILNSTTSEALHILDASSSGNNQSLVIEKNENANNVPILGFKKSRGSFASPLAINSGDRMGALVGIGYDGVTYPQSSCRIAFVATEAFSTTAKGAKISFATNANGTTTRKERIEIGQDGSLVFLANTSGQVSLIPSTTTSSYSLVLPNSQASGSSALINDGSGNLSWIKYVQPSSGDLNETSFSAANNQTSPVNVTGFSFSSSVRSFKALVSIYIDASVGQFECIELIGINKGTSWELIQGSQVGDTSGFIFSITSGGQIQYKNDNYPGFVAATVKFRAITTTV